MAHTSNALLLVLLFTFLNFGAQKRQKLIPDSLPGVKYAFSYQNRILGLT